MSTEYDLIIRNGTIYDGSGSPPATGDVAVNGTTISAMGRFRTARGRVELDAQGLAVAPGFINMLSWANRSLLEDGRSQSDIRQGVTLEVLGEGSSMGPLTDTMKKQMREQQGDIKYAVEWTTMGEYHNSPPSPHPTDLQFAAASPDVRPSPFPLPQTAPEPRSSSWASRVPL